jgi:hypothetical protein
MSAVGDKSHKPKLGKFTLFRFRRNRTSSEISLNRQQSRCGCFEVSWRRIEARSKPRRDKETLAAPMIPFEAGGLNLL